MPQSVRYSFTHTENKSITTSEKVCPVGQSSSSSMSDRTEQPVVETMAKAMIERSNPLLKQVKSKTLNIHKDSLGPTKGANPRRLSGGD